VSIILDALKKAQKDRKHTVTVTTYTYKNKGQKLRWIAYSLIGVIIAGTLVYLYVPAFHRPKVVAQVITKPQLPQTKPVAVEAKKVEVKPVETKPVEEKKELPVSQLDKPDKLRKPGKPVRLASVGTTKKPAALKKKKIPVTPKEEAGIAIQPVDNKKLEALYNQALKEMDSGRFEEAKRLYRTIIIEKPDHIEALNNLGVIATQEGNTEEAIYYFRKILEYKKDYAKAYNNLGLLLMREGDMKLAEEYFRKSIEIDGESVESYLNISALLRSERRLEEASRFLEVLLHKGVKNPVLYLSYAITRDELNQPAEAVRYYRAYLNEGVATREERSKIIERVRVLEENQSAKNR